MRLGEVTQRQRDAVSKLVELKKALVVPLTTFDLVLIPHSNQKRSLHVLGMVRSLLSSLLVLILFMI